MLSNLISLWIIFFLWKKSRANSICSIITLDVYSGIELQSSIISSRDPFGWNSKTKYMKLLSSNICSNLRTLTHYSSAQCTCISFNRFFNPVYYLIIFYLLSILIATFAIVGVFSAGICPPMNPLTSLPPSNMLIADIAVINLFSSSF